MHSTLNCPDEGLLRWFAHISKGVEIGASAQAMHSVIRTRSCRMVESQSIRRLPNIEQVADTRRYGYHDLIENHRSE